MTQKGIKETKISEELITKINDILRSGEPKNISKDTYANYTGYTPQSVIDAINGVLGYDEWGFDDLCSETIEVEMEKGKGMLVVAQVKVWLINRETYRTAYGQGRVTRGDVGDGRKSAQTDALKKALSYFSIGNRAYLGLLDINSSAEPKSPEKAKIEPRKDTVETIEMEKTFAPKYIETAAGKALSKAYFMTAKEMGIDADKAHDLAVKNFKLNSYTDITKEQLMALTQGLKKKKEERTKKEAEKPIDVSLDDLDGEL